MDPTINNGGVRVVDLNGLTDIGLGDSTTVVGDPMQELAHSSFPNSRHLGRQDPKIHPVTGDMYLYGNDDSRGLDI